MNTYGEILRNSRELEELSQRKLGEKIGVSATTICDIENGSKTPSIKLHRKFAEFFGWDDGNLYFFRKIVKNKPRNTVEMRLIELLEDEIDRLRRLV